MKVVVLGAGVVGVTTAYYASVAGHDVTVIDRQSGPALETSFANAGEISPGYAAPWAAPGIPLKALKWLLMEHAPLVVQPRPDPAMISWGLRMLRNCTPQRYAINKARMVRLSTYSRAMLQALRETEAIEYDHRTLGTLQLFRTHAQLDSAEMDIGVLKGEGVNFELLDAEGCRQIEPGLRKAETPIVGGLRLPADETGDCFKFTQALAAIAEQRGVHFMWNAPIEKLERQGNRVSVRVAGNSINADAFVLACGSWSPVLARPIGLHLPVYPVKGYSITVPVGDDQSAPQSTLLDETYKVAITRLGDRIRVGGMAELAGFDRSLNPRRQRTLEHSLLSLFPQATESTERSFWSGFRPMTPDGTPLIGKTGFDNLYLNTGHGTLGWTMSCGSARVVADLISGQMPDIRADDLGLDR
ncbi:D-amino acid dehydrogenase [Hyphomonas oceanitis]|uniref:D-amino acid dehydrogenase n=1 Tax=Hyphomonas oceanitis TaxID=81033 RepID=UPI0030011F4F